MNFVKVSSCLLAWYLLSIALIFLTGKLIQTTGWDAALVVLVVLVLCLTFFLSIRRNFLNDVLGRLETFAVLVVLLIAACLSAIYLGMFLYGA